MTPCYDEGVLRGYLDNAASPDACAAIEAHLLRCCACQEHLEKLQMQRAHIEMLLPEPEPADIPDTAGALYRFQQTIATRQQQDVQHPASTPASAPLPLSERVSIASSWRNLVNSITRFLAGHSRATFATLVTVFVIASVLFIPPLRAAADQLLQVFRVQNVVFVPISPERLAQLEELEIEDDALFVSEPEAINEPGEPRTVADAAEAAEYVDFSPHSVNRFTTEPITTEVAVVDRTTVEFQVNVETLQQVLEMLDITDAQFPPELGDAPIVADVPPSVNMHYVGDDYELMLHQGTSPEVSLPDNVDLTEVGTLMLRMLGMEAQQAETLSREIDWSTTLIFPFRSDIGTIRQVTIDGAEGLMTSGSSQHDGEWVSWKSLYWQQGDHFYVLLAEGDLSSEDMLEAARSVR
jgi:hypothetical protein